MVPPGGRVVLNSTDEQALEGGATCQARPALSVRTAGLPPARGWAVQLDVLLNWALDRPGIGLPTQQNGEFEGRSLGSGTQRRLVSAPALRAAAPCDIAARLTVTAAVLSRSRCSAAQVTGTLGDHRTALVPGDAVVQPIVCVADKTVRTAIGTGR